MSSQRQDYILRQIDLLRQLVRRLMLKRPDPELDEALLLALHLQEKLFPIPPAEFLRLDLPAQIELLRRNEPVAAGNENCRAYAALLAETARIYEHKGQPDLAAGARQMGLYAALSVVLGDANDGEATALARELLAAVDVQTLHPPVVELLRQFHASPA
ncbi:MAG: hypothetical protein ABUL61_05525 [Oleiharenicola lentus]